MTLQTRATGRRVSSTNAKGSYKFESLEPGSYALIFERDGFASLTRGVILTFDDDSGDVDVTLVPQAEKKPHRFWLIRSMSRLAGWFRSAGSAQEIQ